MALSAKLSLSRVGSIQHGKLPTTENQFVKPHRFHPIHTPLKIPTNKIRFYSSNEYKKDSSEAEPSLKDDKYAPINPKLRSATLTKGRFLWGGLVLVSGAVAVAITLDKEKEDSISESLSEWYRGKFPLSEDELANIEKALDIHLENGKALEREERIQKCFALALQACEAGDWDKLENIQHLLTYVKNTKGYNVFLALVEKGNLSKVRSFCDRFPDTDILHSTDLKKNNALHIAVINGHCDLVDLLTDFILPNSTNRDGKTAVNLAIENGQARVLNMLSLDNNNIASYLHQAVKKGQVGCFEILCSKLDDTDSHFKQTDHSDHNNTLLHLAVMGGKFEMLEYLLTQKYNICKGSLDLGNSTKKTPLHLAAQTGDVRMIEFLFKKGAKLDSKDKDGNTALHLAAKNVHPEAIWCLVHLGAKTLEENNFRNKPIDFLVGNEAKIKRAQAYLIKAASIQFNRQKGPPDLSSPENIVLQGGGAKGIAYLGVFKGMEEAGTLKGVKRIAGTSAGAIYAALVATGHTSADIEKLLKQRSLASFFDYTNPRDEALLEAGKKAAATPKIGNILNVIKHAANRYWSGGQALIAPIAQAEDLYRSLVAMEGLCSGEALRKWLEEQISSKTKIPFCTFKELKNLCENNSDNKFKELHVFVTKISNNEIVQLSAEEGYEDLIISDAVRCSMSIPGIFEPHELYFKNTKGDRCKQVNRPDKFVDGGLLRNFPIEAFDRNKYQISKAEQWGGSTNAKTLGIKLVTKTTGLIDDNESLVKSVEEAEKNLDNFIPFSVVQLYWNAEEILQRQFSHDKDRTIDIPVTIGTLDVSLKQSDTDVIVEASKNAYLAAIGKEKKSAALPTVQPVNKEPVTPPSVSVEELKNPSPTDISLETADLPLPNLADLPAGVDEKLDPNSLKSEL
jgi:predicted acylesterase/phospholipase RssA/ankyrin repeat protein